MKTLEQPTEFPEPIEIYNRYDCGVTIHHPEPNSTEIKHMVYLVAYDVCSPSRLRQVAKACEQFGIRIEKSVFECDLPQELFEMLWCILIDLIDEEEDAVVAYRICASCHRQIESMGIVPRPKKKLCYIL